ncbi:MAG: exodeoxyribonuclease VII large subunit [Thermoplasmata archaeon]
MSTKLRTLKLNTSLERFFALKIYSVTELNFIIKKTIENEDKLLNLFVKGEISDCKYHEASGHIYFTLKDESSRIKCVIFRKNNLLTFKPESGMKVIVQGSIQLYHQRSEIQLIVSDLQPEGLGAQYLMFLQVKEKLQKEGLFDESRKKKLPKYPSCIGVVTSPQGAVFYDIIKVVKRRFPIVNIVLYPTHVQGDYAEEELCKGIEVFNRIKGIDVIILARGGGPNEELLVFNSERLARTIASSRIPIISAVGHETDYTIADFVADVRAPTPSAAAELAVPDREKYIEDLNAFEKRIIKAWNAKIHSEMQRLENILSCKYFRTPTKLFEEKMQNFEELYSRLITSMKKGIEEKNKKLDITMNLLDALSPSRILERGYSITTKNEKIIRSIEEIETNDLLILKFKDGNAYVRVERVKKEDKKMKNREGKEGG